MIIPWPLIGSLLASLGLAAAWVRLRGGDVGRTLDTALTIVLPAVVVARAVVVLRDLALGGALPPLPAILTLGAGLSAPAGVLAAMAFGARSASRRDCTHLPEAGAVALLAWQVLAVVRDELQPGPPVALLEAAVWGGLLVLLIRRRRADGEPPAQAAADRLRLLVVPAAAGLLAGQVLRPTLPTPDSDLDAALTLVTLLVAVGVVRGRDRLARAGGLVGVGIIAAVVAVAALAPRAQPLVASPDALPPSLRGAIVAGGEADPATVPGLDGDGLAALVADAPGPVVVNLWAAWCPPCHAEAAAVARAARVLPDDVTMIGVLVDDDPADGQVFADAYGLGFPTLLDDGASDALGSVGLPTTVVLNADGTVAHREVGGLDVGSLAAAVGRASRG